MNSVWTKNSDLPKFSSLQEDKETDVLIIGGGMAGILCAYMLTEAGVDCILVEANTICSGITKNTTAKITSQHGLVYNKIIREFPDETARLYLEANQFALDKYAEICSVIDCDFEVKDSFVYSINNKKIIDDEIKALGKIGYKAQFTKDLPLPFPVAGAVKFKNQAQFNPLKFTASIAKNLNIYEHTKVQQLTEHTALTPNGNIRAKKIIVATHFPTDNKHGSYFLKMYQHRSYVIALENAPDVRGMYVDEAEKGMSFRNYNNLLLIGGGDHRTGKKGGNWKELRRFAGRYYPEAKERYFWATQDCMTLDGIPYIGQYSKNTPDFYVATGFNKWGMTSSMVAASILTDLVIGKKNKYEKVFSPSRSILRPQLAINAFEAVSNLFCFTGKRCPHMGCSLKWNKEEKTWDCPCHGSRFTEDGELIDNPATDDIK